MTKTIGDTHKRCKAVKTNQSPSKSQPPAAAYQDSKLSQTENTVNL